MARVSVIIPGRTERYFQQTIDSVLAAATGDVEIIAVIDGDEAEPKVHSDDPRVKVIRLEKSIGQRAGYNLGVRESTGKYVMKLDAHAKVSHGFDEQLQAHCPDDAVVIPEMRRLNVHTWEDKPRGKTHFMFFATDLYCYYWQPYRKRPEAAGDYPEVLTGQGSSWFCTREWNDHIGLLDDGVGSWGKVGIEVSLRTWLCGGTQIVNKKVWQAHWFRVHEGGFPYPFTGRQVARARDYVSDNYFFNDNAFENQTRPFRWLIEKFAPIPTWEAYMADGFSANRVALYYSHGDCEETLLRAVRKQLTKAAAFIPIISVTDKPVALGTNIVMPCEKPGREDMYRRIRRGLEAVPKGAAVYLCEHDVFYHPSHFAKVPKNKTHVWFNKARYYWAAGLDTFFPAPGRRAYSQGLAYRETWIRHFDDMIRQIDEGNDKPQMKLRFINFKSERPNVDIRHGENQTREGSGKRPYLSGQLKGERNIGAWGSPKHFQSKVGYKGVMRWDVINYLVRIHDYKSYLEIGVFRGECLQHVRCEHKDGVDPAGKCNYQITSDEFFRTTPETQTYDIIFVDGLHEAEQAQRDVDNALTRLNPGGVVVMHDCTPRNREEQMVPNPGGQKAWTGDVWRAFVGLRRRPDLEMYVVDTNNGIGIVRPGAQVPLGIDATTVSYDEFAVDKEAWLNLKTVRSFLLHEKQCIGETWVAQQK